MSRSSSSTAANSTQNYYDSRSVIDAGGGVVGTGNTIDSSRSYQSFTDSRDTSTKVQTNITTDGGAFDVVRSVADGLNKIGLAQTDAARDIALSADKSMSGSVSLAMKAQEDAASFNELAASKSFDLARSTSTQAFASSSEALGFGRDTFDKVIGLARDVVGQAGTQAAQVASTANAAYASASDTSSGNKTLLYAGVAAVALVGLAVAFNAFRN